MASEIPRQQRLRFHEVHTADLPSPTTLYSGARVARCRTDEGRRSVENDEFLSSRLSPPPAIAFGPPKSSSEGDGAIVDDVDEEGWGEVARSATGRHSIVVERRRQTRGRRRRRRRDACGDGVRLTSDRIPRAAAEGRSGLCGGGFCVAHSYLPLPCMEGSSKSTVTTTSAEENRGDDWVDEEGPGNGNAASNQGNTNERPQFRRRRRRPQSYVEVFAVLCSADEPSSGGGSGSSDAAAATVNETGAGGNTQTPGSTPQPQPPSAVNSAVEGGGGSPSLPPAAAVDGAPSSRSESLSSSPPSTAAAASKTALPATSGAFEGDPRRGETAIPSSSVTLVADAIATRPVARLVVRASLGAPFAGSGDVGNEPTKHRRAKNNEGAAVATVLLDYRPLVVHATLLLSIVGERRAAIVGLFVGGSDDGGNGGGSGGVNGSIRLRLYAAELDAGKERMAFREVPLLSKIAGSSRAEVDANAWSFPSPVMALDSVPPLMKEGDTDDDDGACNRNDDHNDDRRGWLAVGCRDGTIVIVSYWTEVPLNAEADSPVVVASARREMSCVVDGPIVALHLRHLRRSVLHHSGGKGSRSLPPPTTTVDLVAGSLCGFACWLRRTVGVGGAGSIRGPRAVVEGLWDGRFGAEDGVTAVHGFDFAGATMIAVGTHGGRLVLFAPRRRERLGSRWEPNIATVGEVGLESEKEANATIDEQLFGDDPHMPCLEAVWQCHLPYPIHGITLADVGRHGLLELLVSTRRSIHLFRVDTVDLAESIKQRMQEQIFAVVPR